MEVTRIVWSLGHLAMQVATLAGVLYLINLARRASK